MANRFFCGMVNSSHHPMKPKVLLVTVSALGLMALTGCTNSEGRFRPIDPLGRAIFDALDPGPRRPNYGYNDQQYIDQQYGPDLTNRNQRPGRDYVWLDGRYESDHTGRSVWVPGHWTRVQVQQ